MDTGRIAGSSLNNTLNNAKSRALDKAKDDSFEKRLKSAMDKNDEQELKKACKEFESIFLSMMYKQMKATIPKSDLIPGDTGREVFQSMLDDKLMEKASDSSSTGLADMLYKQLGSRLKATYKLGDSGVGQAGEKKVTVHF